MPSDVSRKMGESMAAYQKSHFNPFVSGPGSPQWRAEHGSGSAVQSSAPVGPGE
jgi:hypothetical protein